MIVIICDGSSRGNPGPASIGIIIWERYKGNNSRMIAPTKIIRQAIGTATNMEAEWTALCQSVSYVVTNCNREEEVYIYCDSQTVVKQATKVWKVKHENIKKIFADFENLSAKLPNLNITWVPRQLVYLADKAAQRGAKQ